MADVLELGHQHTLRWVSWSPDRELNPQYAHLPDVERYGAIVTHPRRDTGEPCDGFITVLTPDSEQALALDRPRPTWHVESWDPLTLSPSLLCACGDHGFIRAGAWVPA